MGRINVIWNPNNWKIINTYQNKRVKSDIVYDVVIGSSDDEGYYELNELMSKTVYECIINRNYKIRIYPYSVVLMLIFNENNELVSPVNGVEINMVEFTEEQLEEVQMIKNDPKGLVRKPI